MLSLLPRVGDSLGSFIAAEEFPETTYGRG